MNGVASILPACLPAVGSGGSVDLTSKSREYRSKLFRGPLAIKRCC
jgi:hypothetical protein